MGTFAFRRKVLVSLLITVLAMVVSTAVFAPGAFAATPAAAETTNTASSSGDLMWVVIAAAIAFGAGAIAAGMAISHVGSAAMGAISERPEIASQALIFIALAEGIVVFGFITALMILGKA
ncbi:ATP synthase subunit C [Parasphaerochaeta coccoides]|uniref:H+transporting two-sector ATPase C subunit n=1 Tax=Parasphaerochaeta coccoides (strain ATCC BAA-1237 / DSM 17374 / SPN1) TaxID=760011 RepID=F4GH86_PARC1|nr:ATP synthase subunit C [Parasphaerochaeta coccoides]AEC01985.1 H+transporting two-sector ATPase C subunit [Parasphaerochaeta coccoides DSM 17374]